MREERVCGCVRYKTGALRFRGVREVTEPEYRNKRGRRGRGGEDGEMRKAAGWMRRGGRE